MRAVAKAFATACEVGSDVNMQMFEEIFMEEDAFAFAHVRPPPPLPLAPAVDSDSHAQRARVDCFLHCLY